MFRGNLVMIHRVTYFPILPVDNILVGAVDKFSTGALSDGKPLDAVHPAFRYELFGQRLGIQAC